jgi:hypothetical protein
LNKKFWEELIVYFPSSDTGHIKNDESSNSSIVACVFVTVVTFLTSRCLATTEHFNEPLPSNDRGMYIQTQRQRRGIFNYAVEMGSGALIYVPSFIKIGSGIQKLIGGYTHTQTAT